MFLFVCVGLFTFYGECGRVLALWVGAGGFEISVGLSVSLEVESRCVV